MDLRILRRRRPTKMLVLIEHPGRRKLILLDEMVQIRPAKRCSIRAAVYQKLLLAFLLLRPKLAYQSSDIEFGADLEPGLEETQEGESAAVAASIRLRKWVTGE